MTTRIAFHSFKGGAGRSTGLTNVAFVLAKNGYKVGVIDLDIEAAGLTTIFKPTPAATEKRSVQDYLERKQETGDVDVTDYVIRNFQNRDKFRHFNLKGVNMRGRERIVDGELHLCLADLKAEQLGETPNEMALISIFGDLFDDFENVPDVGTLDYLLIDGRSGIGGMMIPAIVHADKIAEFFRWSEQHKEGIKQSVDWLDNYLEAVGTEGEVYPVASSVPLYDDTLAGEVTEDSVRTWLEKTSGVMDKSRVVDYAIIPEHSELKIEEKIVVANGKTQDKGHDGLTVASGFEKLASILEDKEEEEELTA